MRTAFTCLWLLVAGTAIADPGTWNGMQVTNNGAWYPSGSAIYVPITITNISGMEKKDVNLFFTGQSASPWGQLYYQGDGIWEKTSSYTGETLQAKMGNYSTWRLPINQTINLASGNPIDAKYPYISIGDLKPGDSKDITYRIDYLTLGGTSQAYPPYSQWLTLVEGKGRASTSTDPYQISTAKQLLEISQYSQGDDYLILTADIDLGGQIFTTPVFKTIFMGVFDGNGHTISNLTLNLPNTDNVGFFGLIGTGGTVRNLGLENVNISGRDSVGGLAGENYGTITKCCSTGTVSGFDSVGGLVGISGNDFVYYDYEYSTIEQCYSTVTVSGQVNVGGLAGENYGTITACYSTGMVSGVWGVGGLVGINGYTEVCIAINPDTGECMTDRFYAARIYNSYSKGIVLGTAVVGGLVGTNQCDITRCYSTGTVSGTDYVGGMVGVENYVIVDVEQCFWDVQVSGQIQSDGGKGLSTHQMQQMSTYSLNGWTGIVWTIEDGKGYPRLAWENAGGQFISEPTVDLSGSGTSTDPYQIHTVEDLQLLAIGSFFSDTHLVLMSDLDLEGISLTRIGYELGKNHLFTGVFDGNGYTISNLTLNLPTGNVGFFGLIGTGGTVRNLGLENVNISGRDSVGGLAGENNGTITGCYRTGTVSGNGNDDSVGGLVGENYGTVTRCYSSSTVTGRNYFVGGLAGRNYGTITECYNTGKVSGTWEVGGLVGENYGTVTRCYSTGTVSGDYITGGLVGTNSDCYYTNTIEQCYSIGTVSGTSYVGGLVGSSSAYTVILIHSFWDIQNSGLVDGVGDQDPDPTGVMGKTTEKMYLLSTFTSAGWDFVGESVNGTEDIWKIHDGYSYPQLAWQIEIPGDVAGTGQVDIRDFGSLAEAWASHPGEPNWNPLCDLHPDGVIDLLDLLIQVENWLR